MRALACKHHMKSQILSVIITGAHEHYISASGCQKLYFTWYLIICGFLARNNLSQDKRFSIVHTFLRGYLPLRIKLDCLGSGMPACVDVCT